VGVRTLRVAAEGRAASLISEGPGARGSTFAHGRIPPLDARTRPPFRPSRHPNLRRHHRPRRNPHRHRPRRPV